MGKTGQHQLTQFKADLEGAKDSFRKKLVLFTPSSTFSLLLLVFMLSLPPYFSASQSSLPFPLPLYYSKTSYGTKYSRNENCANQINNLEFSLSFPKVSRQDAQRMGRERIVCEEGWEVRHACHGLQGNSCKCAEKMGGGKYPCPCLITEEHI